MTRHGLRASLLIACASLALACGDDDGSGDEPEAGSGGSGRGGSGASGSGGTGGSGTSGSGAGSGGSGTNPAGCPAMAPADASACTMADLECTYGMMECDCDPPQGGGTEMAWDCRTFGGTMQMCPDTEPASGGACTEGRGDCEYGTRICDCNDDVWACWDPADCPTMPPAEGSTCSPVGMECEYDQGGPGGDGECDCEDTGWECGGDFEPEEDGGV